MPVASKVACYADMVLGDINRRCDSFHVCWFYDVLIEVRLNIFMSSEPLDFDPCSFAVYDTALVQYRLLEYRPQGSLYLSGLRFIKHLTSLPPPPLRPLVG